MKKVLSLLAIIFVGLLLASCTDLEDTNTLEITSTPSTTYILGYEGEVVFAFKADGVLYELTWDAKDKKFSNLKIDGNSMGQIEEKLESQGITISGFDFDNVGRKTLTISYKGLSAKFEYDVIGNQELSGTGKANDPYIVRSADHLNQLQSQGKFKNQNSQSRVYIRLAADLDFSGKSLGVEVDFVTIDGSKPLGGNYKVINLSSSFLGNVKNLVMRNIDFVDSISSDYIVGGTAQNITIENVNILGDSYAGRAGYFNTLTGTNIFINCTTYATIIASDSSAGFIRYTHLEGETTFENCFNYGLIQTSKAGYVGGLVAQATKTGKITIINSANYGKIEVYSSLENMTKTEEFLNTNSGVFTLVGTGFNNDGQSWVVKNGETFTFLSHVSIDDVSLEESDIELVKTNEALTIDLSSESYDSELKLEDILYLNGNSVSDVATVEITVVHSNAAGHNLVNGQLVKNNNSGNTIIYKKAATIESGIVTLPTLEFIKENAKHPFTSNINTSQSLSDNLTVQTELFNDLGYDIYYGGLYRVANGVNKNITMNIFGYNQNNELVFIVIGTGKIDLPTL